MRRRTALAALAGASCGRYSEPADIIVGAKDFTEQDVLCEILAQHIAASTGLRVRRLPRLGGSFVCHKALLTGAIDLYAEYSGTAYMGILKQARRDDVLELMRKLYAELGIVVEKPLGFENQFAIVVRGEDAERYGLSTMSDAARVAPQWRAGFGYEFLERADGYSGLAKVYGWRFSAAPRVMDLGLIYRALLEKQVDVIAGNSTDGQIARFRLKKLDDDRHYFPPYEAVPLVRRQTLAKFPALEPALNSIAGKISADAMRAMNNEVERDLADPAEVAREFLKRMS